ncbi:MAG: diguanylate cyclase domain-containing protein [Acidimicrobiia bacterium]
MTANSSPSLAARAPAWVLPATYGVIAVPLALTAALRLGTTAAAVAMGLLGVLAVAALILGARRTSRIGTNPWVCFAAGIALTATAATVVAFAVARSEPRPIETAWLEFAGTLAIAVGFAHLARLRDDPASRTAALDATVIGAASIMVLWVALVAPLHLEALSADRRIALALEPVREGMLVAILAWISLARGRRSRALYVLALAVALLLFGDLAASIGHAAGTRLPHAVGLLGSAAVATFGLAGLFATHDVRTGTITLGRTSERPRRSVLIGIALLMGPLATVIGDLSTVDGMIMIGACSTLLAVGVVARFVNLVHQNQQAHEATAASERRFRMLADSAPAGIFELARGMRVTYANAEGTRMLGTEVVGGTVPELVAYVADASRDAFTSGLESVAQGDPVRVELQLTPDREARWLAWQSVPVPAPGPSTPLAFASLLDITELKQAQDALARQATHDPLTGLPNRRLLIEALITSLAELGRGHRTGTVALMFIDLDGFKLVNDVLGHDCGDALLKTAAARLRNAVREHDMVARFGGDEFVVLMRHVADRGELHDVAKRILESVSAPINVGGEPARVGASIGIATATGPDDDPDALVRNADAAMYKAKEHGRGRYEFFRPEISPSEHRML